MAAIAVTIQYSSALSNEWLVASQVLSIGKADKVRTTSFYQLVAGRSSTQSNAGPW
jgi:hypothetical protein